MTSLLILFMLILSLIYANKKSNSEKSVGKFINPRILERIWFIIPGYLIVIISVTIVFNNMDTGNIKSITKDNYSSITEDIKVFNTRMDSSNITYDEIVNSDMLVEGNIKSLNVSKNEIDVIDDRNAYVVIKENANLEKEIKARVYSTKIYTNEPFYSEIAHYREEILFDDMGEAVKINYDNIPMSMNILSCARDPFNYGDTFSEEIIYSNVIALEVPVGFKVNTYLGFSRTNI